MSKKAIVIGIIIALILAYGCTAIRFPTGVSGYLTSTPVGNGNTTWTQYSTVVFFGQTIYTIQQWTYTGTIPPPTAPSISSQCLVIAYVLNFIMVSIFIILIRKLLWSLFGRRREVGQVVTNLKKKG